MRTKPILASSVSSKLIPKSLQTPVLLKKKKRIKIVALFAARAPLSRIAEQMAKYAMNNGSKDNVTVGLAEITGDAMMLWLFDGHGGTETVATAVTETNLILDNANKLGWEQAFAHRDGREVASPPVQEESELEKAYRGAWGSLSPEHQKLCFPNLKVAEDCKAVHDLFAEGSRAFGDPIQKKIFRLANERGLSQEGLFNSILDTFKSEGHSNRYLFTHMLREMLPSERTDEKLHETVGKFSEAVTKLTKLAQNSGGLVNNKPGADIVKS